MIPLVLCTLLAQPAPVALTVSAAPAPRNLYRWQLLPSLLDQTSGDAVAVYRKATAALKEIEPDRQEFYKLVAELDNLRAVPLAEVDRKRIKEIVAKFKKPLDLIAEAARREQANWDFVTERLRKVGLAARIEEIQAVRDFLPFLALQARQRLLEDRPEEAVRVAATAFSLARQLNECPTLIAHFVGLACARVALSILEDCIQHPKCPSLYGPLSDLPRPLLSPRMAYEGERISTRGTIPSLSKVVADPVTALDADTVDKVLRVYRGLVFDEPQRPGTRILDRVTLATAMHKKQAAAMEAMRAAGYDEATIKKTPIFNAGLLHGLLQYEDGLGRMAAAAMLPFPQARIQFEEIRKKYPSRRPLPLGPEDAALPLWRIFLPAGEKILLADLRLQRRLELLRAAEGLRQHAAQAGKWPDKLDEVKGVSLPNDPATGKPFAYLRAGDVAILDAPLPKPDASKDNAMTLRLTLRKPGKKP